MPSICTSKQVVHLFKSFFTLCLFFALIPHINAQTYVNGNLSTGVTASSGETAPACATWSEVQVGNNNAGYTASQADSFSVADDFIVPAGSTWNITKFTFYAYSTGYTGDISPFDSVRLKIYNTNPAVGNPGAIFGDLVANRFISSSFSKMYRIFNGDANTDRKIWQIEASAPITLAAGTYWVEWQVGTDQTSNFSPASTVVGTTTQPGNNGQQHTLSVPVGWAPMLDGDAVTPTFPQDMPFKIDYSTAPCTGTPAPGNTIFTNTAGCVIAAPVICPGILFTLSLQNATPGTGISYQWQSSPDGITYTNITGATNNSLITSLSSTALFYHAVVTCASGTPGTSTAIQVGLTAANDCYCVPAATDCTDGDIITNVTLGTLNNTSDCGPDGYTYYGTNTAVVVPDLIRNVPTPITVTAGGGLFTEFVAAWVDFDHNGSFDASEYTSIGTTVGGILNANINVPGTAPLGPTRMRVRVRFFTGLTPTDACLGYTFGETEDYLVNIVDCTPGIITSQPISHGVTCGKDTLFSVAATGNGLAYQWQERISTTAPWTNVVNGTVYTGATTPFLNILAATGTMNGYQYHVIITGACGPQIISDSAILTVNPIVVNVSPVAVNVCTPTTALIPLSITTINFDGAMVSQTSAYPSGPLNITIPDADGDPTGITNSITVPALPPGDDITAASVTLNVNHTWAGDLIIALKAPNSNVLNLDYGLNATGGAAITTGFTNTVISSAGVTALVSGVNPWTGVFAPDAQTTLVTGFPSAPTSLSPVDANVFNFQGLYSVPNGNWSLGLYDVVTPDQGTLVNWTLNLTHSHLALNHYEGIWSPVTGLFLDAAGTIPYNGTATDTVYLLPTVSTVYTVTPVTATCTGTPVSIPVTVSAPVGTITDPVSSATCENNNTSFTVNAASGTNIVYQWQVSTDGGTVYTNVVDGGVYSGASTSILTLTNVPLTFNGYKYKALLSVTACSSNASSGVATLTVSAGGAVITSQPVDAAVCEGSDHTFTIAATGTGLSYQWQLSSTGCAGTFTNIAGATGTSYTVVNPTVAQNGFAYHCVISGACNPLLSECATLSVNSGVTITTQPSDVSACAGADANFSVSASGGGLTYQWQVSTGGPFTNIAGATGSTITIPTVTATLSGNQYQVIITGSGCPAPATSTTVTLTVTTAPVITTQPVNATVCNGANSYFVVASSGTGVNYQWQVSNGGPFVDIPGETLDTLHINPATTSLNGNQYQVILTITGCTGTTTSSVVSLTVNESPVITSPPSGTTACEGDVVTFTTTATGTNLTYQWQVSTDAGITFTDIAGASSASYILTTTAAMNNNQYHVVVTGSCAPAAVSDPATLVVNAAPAISSQPVGGTVCAGSPFTVTVTASGTNLTYQWELSTSGCTGPFTPIAGATSASYTEASLTVNLAYHCIVTGACGTTSLVSDCAAVSVSSAIDITLQPADQTACAGSDAVFSVVAGTPGINYQWQVSTDGGTTFTDITGATNATLTITGVTATLNGNQYQVILTNASCPAPTTSTAATLTVNELPLLTLQPASVAVCEGALATFTASASGTNISYQWQVSTDGGVSFSDITGATAAAYTINPVTAVMNNNQYQVVVTGACTPAATSAAATLTVNTGAVISTQPLNASACTGTDASFTVAGTGSALSYQWQVSTDGGTTFTDITGATNAVLTITSVSAALNNNQYHVTVTNTGCGPAVVSVNVILTVQASPVVSATADAASVCSGTAVQLEATGATSYTWNPGALTGSIVTVQPTVDPGTPGTPNTIIYTVTGTDATGCTGTSTVSVTANPLPVISITANPAVTALLPGQSTVLTATVTPTGTYNYSWQKNTVDIAGAVSSSITVNAGEAGLYTAMASGTGGSCASTSNSIVVTDSVNAAFIIYPNPNNGQFTITSPSTQLKNSVAVYDNHGSRVSISSRIVSEQVIQVDMGSVSSGLYIVVLYNGAGERILTGKILVSQ